MSQSNPDSTPGHRDGMYNESEVLSRIESLLRFTTQEIDQAESKAQAFEQLSEFENHLIIQQKKINAALLNLQLYRDDLERDWNQEKLVRDNTHELMAKRMSELDQTLKAQEKLIQYAEGEQKFLRKLLAELKEKRTLNEEDVKRILSGHELLLAELVREKRH